MKQPKFEPEVVRAKVALAIEELRDGLRHMGWSPDEIWALAWTVERRALDYPLRPDVDNVGR